MYTTTLNLFGKLSFSWWIVSVERKQRLLFLTSVTTCHATAAHLVYETAKMISNFVKIIFGEFQKRQKFVPNFA